MKALFDLSFQKFVTPTIIKIIYVLIMVMLAVGYLFFVVTAFMQSTGFGFLVLLILGPLFVLIYLALARAGLESLVAQIRTAENTTELVRLAGGMPPAGGARGPVPGAPNGPIDGPGTGGSTPPTNPYTQ